MAASLELTLLNVIELKQKDVLSVKFCSILPQYKLCFAAVGLHFASIYRIGNEAGQVDLEQAYADSDDGENFYSTTWADKGDSRPLLVMAGKRGIVKVVDIINLRLDVALIGHSNEIMDITTHSVDTNMIFSASKDESVRLWNIKTQVCIAIFAGERGHRTDVLSVAVHPAGNIVASSGMDHTIKLWNLASADVNQAIAKSYVHDDFAGNIAFVAHTEQYPIFSTDKVHRKYVDCIRWVGDLILSKSLCNRVALWTPDPLRARDAVCVLREFSLSKCNEWFMKMAVCDARYIFGAGNTSGDVQLFHISPGALDEETHEASANFITEIGKANANNNHERFETGCVVKPHATIYHESGVPSEIRDLDFSVDGNFLVCCSSRPTVAYAHSKICVWSVSDAKIK